MLNNFFSRFFIQSRLIIGIALLALTFLYNFTSAQTLISLPFSYDLKFGDNNGDVLRLQQILNSDPETQVAFQGPGGKGLETNYFGPATLSAVIRFQEKYSSEILVPTGLSRGTGFVGQKTRDKLNFFLESSIPSKVKDPILTPSTLNQAENSNPNQTDPSSLLSPSLQTSIFSGSTELFTGFISSYSGLPGSTITLSGGGFTPTGNIVHFGDDYEIKNLNSSSNGIITFTVPTDIAKGRYDVFVSNKKGKSEDKTFFVILSANSLPPKITSIFPSSGIYGQEITIHGENFTSDNEIRAGYGIISGLKSKDSKTITFKVEPFPEAFSGKKKYNNEEIEWPIYFYVVNSNGISEQSGQFLLKI
ncbi:MAG: IPT/TIG domain-containing protein [Patescibacteria group bacterium]